MPMPFSVPPEKFSGGTIEIGHYVKRVSLTDAHSEPCQTSEVDFFAKNVYG